MLLNLYNIITKTRDVYVYSLLHIMYDYFDTDFSNIRQIIRFTSCNTRFVHTSLNFSCLPITCNTSLSIKA